jgi:hypothetical protein
MVGSSIKKVKKAAAFKKAAQNFLLIWAMGVGRDNAHGPDYKVFLLLFVHKK